MRDLGGGDGIDVAWRRQDEAAWETTLSQPAPARLVLSRALADELGGAERLMRYGWLVEQKGYHVILHKTTASVRRRTMARAAHAPCRACRAQRRVRRRWAAWSCAARARQIAFLEMPRNKKRKGAKRHEFTKLGARVEQTRRGYYDPGKRPMPRRPDVPEANTSHARLRARRA